LCSRRSRFRKCRHPETILKTLGSPYLVDGRVVSTSGLNPTDLGTGPHHTTRELKICEQGEEKWLHQLAGNLFKRHSGPPSITCSRRNGTSDDGQVIQGPRFCSRAPSTIPPYGAAPSLDRLARLRNHRGEPPRPKSRRPDGTRRDPPAQVGIGQKPLKFGWLTQSWKRRAFSGNFAFCHLWTTSVSVE
jgi:hypothetical protein